MHPSASFSATLRVHLDDRPGAFADLARAIADAGGLLGAIDLVRVEDGRTVQALEAFARVLRFDPEREVRGEEVRLVEIEPDASIERRNFPHTSNSQATSKPNW